MKILVILFCFVISLVQCRVHDNCWLQCDFRPYVAKITCPKEGAVTDCECKLNDEAGSTCGDLPLTEATKPTTWENCYTLAHEKRGVTELDNTNFRFENGDNTICYFLSKCQPVAGECAPHDTAPCVCGPSDDDGCDASIEGVCTAPAWNENGLHWTCLDDGGKPFNPYDEATPTLRTGTTCETSESCSTWKWKVENAQLGDKKAKVTCETEWKSSTDGYELETMDENPIDILPDVEESNDAECKCDTLELTDGTLDTDGLTLLCDDILSQTGESDTGIKYGIQYGNKCTLLCDNHFVLYVECYRGLWQNTAVYPFEPVTATEIKC